MKYVIIIAGLLMAAPAFASDCDDVLGHTQTGPAACASLLKAEQSIANANYIRNRTPRDNPDAALYVGAAIIGIAFVALLLDAIDEDDVSLSAAEDVAQAEWRIRF